MRISIPGVEVHVERVGSRLSVTYDCESDANAAEFEKGVVTMMNMAQLAVAMTEMDLDKP